MLHSGAKSLNSFIGRMQTRAVSRLFHRWHTRTSRMSNISERVSTMSHASLNRLCSRTFFAWRRRASILAKRNRHVVQVIRRWKRIVTLALWRKDTQQRHAKTVSVLRSSCGNARAERDIYARRLTVSTGLLIRKIVYCHSSSPYAGGIRAAFRLWKTIAALERDRQKVLMWLQDAQRLQWSGFATCIRRIAR